MLNKCKLQSWATASLELLWGLSAWQSVKCIAEVCGTDNENLIIVSQKIGTKHEISKRIRELIYWELENPKSIESWKPKEKHFKKSGMNCIVLKALAYRAFLCTYADRSGFQMSCGQLSIARPEAPSSLSSMDWCIKFLQRPSVFIVYSNDNLKLSGCQIIWWMLTTLPRFSVSRSVITVFL